MSDTAAARPWPIETIERRPVAIAELDELILAHEALLHRLRRLRQQLMPDDPPDDPPPDCKTDPLVWDLAFSVRTLNCFAHRVTCRLVNPEEPDVHKRKIKWYPAPLVRLSEVAALSRSELLSIPNFGKISYREVHAICVQYGFWRADDRRYDPTRWRYG
jgi:hypothetical protein